MDGVTLARNNGAGVTEDEGKGTPPAVPPDADHDETPEETYRRLGVPYEGDDSEEETPVAEETPDEDDEGEEEEDASSDESTSESASESDWTAVIRNSPARITEVPARQRGDVLQQLFEQERSTADERVRQARTEAQKEFEAWKTSWQRMNSFVREVDDLRENDPDRFAQWENANPQYAATYHRYRAELQNPSQPQQQQADPEAEHKATTKPYIDAINRSPRAEEIWNELQRRDPNGQIYVHTEEGVRRFIRDADELLSKPRQSPGEDRKAAAESRAKKPKADATPSKSQNKLTKARIKEMTQEQVAALPLDELEEAMRSS